MLERQSQVLSVFLQWENGGNLQKESIFKIITETGKTLLVLQGGESSSFESS